MKKHLLIFSNLMLTILMCANSQSTVNYIVSNNTVGSLQTMAGSELLINSTYDDFSSFVESSVFDFWFMGVRYNNFTVSSNGAIRLGTTVVSPSAYGTSFPYSAATGPILAPFFGNLATSASGKVHSVITGVAPNRKCVIEFLNMAMNKTSSSVDGNFQVVLNETSGVIQYIYGNMQIGGIGSGGNNKDVVIGFCSDNSTNKSLSLNHTTFAVNTTATATINNYGTTGVITSLNSTVNGSRREIKFTPPVLAAPTLPVLSGQTANSVNLSWNDVVLGEQGFVIYKSDDGGVTYDFALQTAGNATSATVPNLLGSTTYLFKIYSVSEGALSSALSISGTTTVCGANATNILTLTGSGPYIWSTILTSAWSLNHIPTSCEDVIINYNNASAGDETSYLPFLNNPVALNIDIDIAVKSLTVNNKSTSTSVKSLNISGLGKIAIAGDLVLTCQGANKYDRCSFSTQNKTTINGDVILNRPAALHTVTEGQSAIGSNGNSREQLYLLRGNMIFNKRGYTTDEHTNFTFDKAGTQYLYNYTTPQPLPYSQGIGDTLQAVLFEKIVIGNANVSTLIFGGSGFDGYMETQSREGITIGVNSILDLPANYSINSLGGSSYFKMLSGAKLRLGGNQTISPNGTIYGVAGSNFPGSFSPYTFNPTSSVEYYGANSITQTIYNGVTYANLIATNGSASGRAIKQTTAGTLSVGTSFNINALADVYLGTSAGLGTNTAPVTSTGPFNILATGGLYCNANVVSGVGAFNMDNGSYLGMGHVQGISNLGSATGNIQMTAGRSYNTTSNYIYNGLSKQFTGGGLPITVNDLTTDNPTTVTIGTNQTVNGVDSLKQGVFDISSVTITHNGTGTMNSIGGKMKADQGIVEMKGNSGTVQNLSGNWFVNKTISSLINANTKGVTVAAAPADTLLIASALVYGAVSNSVITTNDNITLLSRDTATARFGTMVSGNSIVGKVSIERYLPARKSWRLLSAPVVNASSPFVTASWREGGATLLATGYGTRITGPTGFIGVDETTQRASMKYYDPALNNYTDVINTNSTKVSNSAGYYLFVRGDRSIPVSGAAIPTILRIKGDIITGTQNIGIPAGKFTTFGNPYPSKIDYRTIAKTNLSTSFIVWNPNAAGNYSVGAFETYTLNAGNFVKVPGGTTRNFIESGEAVFIQSNGGAGTLIIAETDKANGSSLPVSRTSSIESKQNLTTPALEINMYTKNTDSSTYLADGILMNFDDNYSNTVDNDDVRKILNAVDNIYIKNGLANLVVDSRPFPNVTDTIKLNLTNTRINAYRFEFEPSMMGNINQQAFLQDKFTGTETLVSLLNITNYKFEVTPDAASRAADRFMIVFKKVAPMRFIKISATRNKDNTATITWYTENENNVNTYIIQHSSDGVNFVEIESQLPSANNNGNPYYIFNHATPADGNNWYKIKATPVAGPVQFSDVATTGIKENVGKPAITIYPNPITGGNIFVNFKNKPLGKYQVKVENMTAQIIYKNEFQLQSNNFKKIINIGHAAAGNYHLTIIDEQGDLNRILFIVK